ncbi:amylo-alpha-1,6-glucosidase [Actinotalea solisilvae]|uniref:amylo-alpha-1,6-glucosidase n=1 Tax=Actinotalea solisilvae TaxID=2072922 RepID=UPI0027DC50E5|nr:amylo-alpha-1,6-glucosidase [Actinotalea solisilvae]
MAPGRGRESDATTAPLLVWSDPTATVTVTAPAAEVDRGDPARPVLRWVLDVEPGRPVSVTWRAATTQGADAVVLPPVGAAPWSVPDVRSDDPRLAALLARSLDDLDGLRLRARFAPEDTFLAAGAPWFFTLFGRDSLWAARMLLPLGTELAAGTLRTLAARQGAVVDPLTAEQPGKILHEVRSRELPLGEDGRVLPPLYYGTIDATPLWVCLLHDAWRWGMPTDEVEALLPAAERALAWMVEHGDADGDGFLEYRDEGGHGLANQGWKDSGDSVQWRDGRLADGPIALCEVQAYAHEAALGGAALLDAFGRPGAERWRAWAARLAEQFRDQFWVADDDGPYPAIALDAAKRPVDSLTSNIGHLLGTGLLTSAEEAVVARRLGSAALDSGYGLRTMSTHEAGYWPLKYHGGAVWTHDTAIVAQGLVRAGHADVAARLVAGLLAAAGEVGFRLPELHGGDARGAVPALVPYPAACRPQAWAAASSVALVGALLGLEVDVPAGSVRVRPAAPSVVGALEVAGLRVPGGTLDVALAADGTVRTARADGLAVEVREAPGSAGRPPDGREP